MQQKENEFAIHGCGKENLATRLRQLIDRHKSARAAAKAWGLSFSTLNNYLNRGTEPAFSVMQTIAIKEAVSLDWLAFGSSGVNVSHRQLTEQPNAADNDFANELLRRAAPADKERLVNAICDIGIKGILSKLQQPDAQHDQPEREYTTQELETMIMALPVRESLKTAFAKGITAGEDADKEILRILESHQQGLSPEGSGNKTTTPAPPLKQKAG
ncbi:XRE family transcriptional regulator [Salmonella enterica]|uniref:XRE family transcriptional regulator n=1 Tax=Salmonella enterica TaxID=28901 RepID=A0A5U0H5U1_SALER|nr:XRE family transcriptional regulator [Salmonella enterica]EAS4196102.1 XRE family transcriptional regulator [Salmonella enterica]EBM1340497.1 XRE family transcriptional regulator [Salmonella enterica]EBM1365787.1 XRE family transcriptional regulator [Salmonella enterica]EBO3621487.1 XRE family transcriptional regulator [Salmonella enterica]